MGLATHLGPWLLGTVKNTTGSTAGTVRNIGATVVTQSFDLTTTTSTNAIYLPAGSQILGIMAYVTTLYSGTAPTIAFSIGGTSVVTAVTPSASVAIQSFTINTTGVPVCKNVGTTDVGVTATFGGTVSAGAMTVVVEYTVRNSDGSYAPTAFTA